VTEAWIEIVAGDGTRRRHVLKSGLTTVGGRRGDVALDGSGDDQLHFWDQPPKVVFVGDGDPPRLRGEARDEASLVPGDVVEWRGARIELGGRTHAVIEEIHAPPPSPASAAPAPFAAPMTTPSMSASADSVDLAWRRLRAGMLIEQGLVEPSIARRWQEAVMRGEFDPDACARDVLGSLQPGATDARVLERSGRLARDLVMSPAQGGARGSARKTRSVFKSGLAAIIVQFLVFGICTLLVVAAMFVARWRLNWSIDSFLDGIGNTFRGS
jgi:hypothetical protein